MKKKLLMRLAAAALAAGMCLSSAGATYFKDVSPNAWYYNAVNKCSNYGYMKGYNDGTFRPNATLTRAECASVIHNLVPDSFNPEPYITDVPNDAWYSDAVTAVGICMGGSYTDTSKWVSILAAGSYEHPIYFYPKKACIRQDFAVGLYNAMGWSQHSWKYHFNDLNSISWGDEYYNYRQAACSMANNRIMMGDTKGNFNPKKSITRAEMAQILCNFAENSSDFIS